MMNNMGRTKELIEREWETTSKLLFGRPLNGIDKYEKWLSNAMEPLTKHKSYVSGKDVYLSNTLYKDDAKFISLDEVDFRKKFEPLNINEIKDIDSIAEAIRERFIYTGNVILGNSQYVAESADIMNSVIIYHSTDIFDSKRVAYSSQLRYTQNIFGGNNDTYSKYVVRAWDTYKNTRSFEMWRSFYNSDCYYLFGVENSSNVMFSFNVRSKQYMIGNAQISPDKYMKLKQKLLEDIVNDLEKDRHTKSLLDFAQMNKPEALPDECITDESDEQNVDLKPVESAFSRTTKLVLGKELTGIDQYGKWLSRGMNLISEGKSALSGKNIVIGERSPYKFLPRDRLLKQGEAENVGKVIHLTDGDLESIDKVKNSVWKIAFFNPEFRLGMTAHNNVKVAVQVDATVDCYYGPIYADNKRCAYSFWPRNSEYMFGSNLSFSSTFGIHIYHSNNISRSFEVDSSSNSSDIYFSHNCENVVNSMFCFNVKNVHNSIGNTPIDADKYTNIKTALLEQITNELVSKKETHLGIYNLPV